MRVRPHYAAYSISSLTECVYCGAPSVGVVVVRKDPYAPFPGVTSVCDEHLSLLADALDVEKAEILNRINDTPVKMTLDEATSSDASASGLTPMQRKLRGMAARHARGSATNLSGPPSSAPTTEKWSCPDHPNIATRISGGKYVCGKSDCFHYEERA